MKRRYVAILILAPLLMAAAAKIKNANIANDAAIALSKLDGSGTMLVGNGSAGSPSYSFTGDTDTGAYRPGTDQYGISVNGVEHSLFFRSSGTNFLALRGSSGGFTGYDSASELGFLPGGPSDGTYIWGYGSTNPNRPNRIDFGTGGADRLSIHSDKVGVKVPLIVEGAVSTPTEALTTCTTARTIDWSLGNDFTLTLTSGSACTLSFSNAVSGQIITIELTNGASAGDATVVWPSIRWAGGTAPTMTTGAAALDICTIKYNGSAYSGSCIQDMSVP